MSARHVLESPDPLSARARAALRWAQARYSGPTYPSPLSVAEPDDAAAHLAAVRERRPGLRRLDAASGPAVGWWTDHEVLVQVDEFRSRLGSGDHRPPPVVRIWAV